MKIWLPLVRIVSAPPSPGVSVPAEGMALEALMLLTAFLRGGFSTPTRAVLRGELATLFFAVLCVFVGIFISNDTTREKHGHS